VTELHEICAAELSAALRRGETSSVEVVSALLSRIDAHNGRIKALCQVFHEPARARAKLLDEERRAGNVRSALHGIPISVKECFDIAGEATTLGLESWRGKRTQNSAAIVTLLEEAGAIVIGRGNLSQTMLFPEARNPVYGQTVNPWSAEHSPGGSSGGDAAAVAAGFVPLAVGSDIGGSLRIPAHFCGVSSLKPTLDRLPARGQRTALPGQEVIRSQSGPLARSVKDIDLFFGAISAGRATELDGRTPPLPWTSLGLVKIERRRVGMFAYDGVFKASDAVARAVERAAGALRGCGVTVMPFDPPGVQKLMDAYMAAISADGGLTLLASIGDEAIDPVLAPLVRLVKLPSLARKALRRGLYAAGEVRTARVVAALGEKSVARYWALTDEIRQYRFRLLDAMAAAELDALLCPVFPTPAFGHEGAKGFNPALSYAMLFNAAQLPAGAVPVTRVRASETRRSALADRLDKHAAAIDAKSVSLPVGVQVAGRPWQEPLVLALMAAIEASCRVDHEFPRTPVTL
jgi:fatty acid amide hydrolase